MKQPYPPAPQNDGPLAAEPSPGMAFDARSREQQAIDRLLAAWKQVCDEMRLVLRTQEFVKAGLYESKKAADRIRGAASKEGSL